MLTTRLLRPVHLLVVFLAATGCDTTRAITAPSTAELLARGAPAGEEHWDLEFMGHALPAAILQAEGVLRIRPDDERLLLQVVRGNVAYAFGWPERLAELAEEAGDIEESERQLARARWYYRRAFELGRYWVSLHEAGWDAALSEGPEAFERWLQRFDEPEQARMLLWTGYAWTAWVNVSRDDMEAVADLPAALALVRRSVQLDPNLEYAAGLTLLATARAEAMAADLDAAEALFREAMERSKGRSMMVYYQYARTVAVKRQDRRLFLRLVRDALRIPEEPSIRLQNALARARLLALYARREELFAP